MSGLSRFGDAEACLVAITVPGGGALLRGAATVFPGPDFPHARPAEPCLTISSKVTS